MHAFQLTGQNLVPNPSFETYTSCPATFGLGGPLQAVPWQPAGDGTPDYFNVCANPGDVGIPSNYFGIQHAHSGVAYAGGYFRYNGFEYREYLQAPLPEPLEAGVSYFLSFYVSLADMTCGITPIGALFTAEPPIGTGFHALNYTPQVESNMGFISDDINWVQISGCFEAIGGEMYITIGNFNEDAESPLDPDCDGQAVAYYYVDDVTLVETAVEEIIFDLGEPITACSPIEIDPDLSGHMYLWSDGSTGPTLVVNTSGTYTLTATSGCASGVDSVEVIIENPPPVEIGPDEIYICPGDTLILSLDPEVSEYEWSTGSTEPEIIITTDGFYQVTLNDGCDITSDNIQVIFLDPPAPFELGEDLYLCPGDEIEFDFDPTLGDFEWQDQNTSSNYIIYQEGIYSLTISNMCGEVSSEIEVTTLELPNIHLGLDDFICDGQTIYLEVFNDVANYIWQDGSTLSSFLITAPGIYSITATNQCGTVNDQITISAPGDPFFELGNDLSLCFGDTFELSPNVTGDFIWTGGATTDTLSITESGNYALTVSNYCGIWVDSIQVLFFDPVVPFNLGDTIPLCPGDQITLEVNAPGANILWQDLSTSDTFIIFTPGLYFVNVYNGCNSNSDTVVVLPTNASPLVDLPNQINLCHGQSIILDAGVSDVNYLWNDNSQNQQLIVSTPGTYSVTVSNSCGTDVDTTIITDGGPAPVVELGNDVQLCSGENVLLTPVFSAVTSWLWHDGSMSSTFTVTGAGSISVAASNSCGSAFDTIQASLLPATPPLDLGADTSLCSGESFVISINTPGVTIEWPDGSGGANYNVFGAGLVYAAITNSCGTSFDTIQVSELPDVPLLDLGIDQSLCPGEIISVDPGIANVQYLWLDGSTGNSYQSTQEETIILTITNDCGTSTDTLEVTESTQGPQLDLGQDIQVCSGETVTIQSGISGVNYEWQDGSTNPDFTTTQSGVFILEVNNNCGSATDTIVVDISGVPPTPVLPADTTLCEGISLVLLSTADAETTIEWQNGSSAPTFTVTTAGVFTLSESNRCGDAADTITVTYLDAPDPFTLGSDATLCPGETLTLNAPSTPYSIMWQDGSNQASIVVNQAATYALQISNECGTATDELVLDYDTSVPQLNLAPTISWCPGDIVILDATQPFPATYIWSTGATTPSIQIVTPGVYTIDVATPCSMMAMEVEVYVGDCIEPDVHNEIYIPNVFSPNDDGINDLFFLSFGSDIQVTAMTGSIFDRWGNLVYSSEVSPFQWDGLFADEVLMPGVYVYLIKCSYLVGGVERTEVFAGDVTLVR